MQDFFLHGLFYDTDVLCFGFYRNWYLFEFRALVSVNMFQSKDVTHFTYSDPPASLWGWGVIWNL